MAGRVIFFEILWKSLQAEPPPLGFWQVGLYFFEILRIFFQVNPPSDPKKSGRQSRPEKLTKIPLEKHILDPKILIFFGPAKPARKNYEIPLENRILEDLEKKIGTSRLKNPNTPQSSIIPYFPKIG